MIIAKQIKLTKLIAIIWVRLLSMTGLSASIVFIISWFDLKSLAPDITTPLILGTAIAIFLGFRTDSANERWFRARVLFDSLSAQARALGLVVAQAISRHARHDTPSLLDEDRHRMDMLITLSAAHVWCLGQQLKKLDPLENKSVKQLLSEELLTSLQSTHNPALSIIYRQTEALGQLTNTNALTDSEAGEIADILRETARMQTEAEGLRDTPFPVHYSYFTHVFIWILIILLSLSLPAKEQLAFYAVPLAVLIGWVFFMIEGIGRYMEEPWENNRNVVPTDSIARNLERDLGAFVLGHKLLPDPIEADDGALY